VFADPQPVLPVATYGELLSSIRQTIAAARERLEQAAEQEKVREAWEIGKLIDEHLLLHKERADYGKKVVARLAGDLHTDESELYHMLRFARLYAILPESSELSWAHYRELLSIHDEVQRKEMTEQAVRERWNHKRLREEIRHLKHRASVPLSLGQVRPGMIYTYRVVKAQAGPLKETRVLDLGFANYFQPEGIENYQEGDIVLFERGKLKKVEAAEQALWTYRAYVTKVIDGDTFDAVIDLGFKITTLQKLRLRRIDTREIESAGGMEAKKYLEKRLQYSPVVIRAFKSDKYDRYLADVFVNGKYINQELLDEGLAIIVKE
jgi:micrococcal nuclease